MQPHCCSYCVFPARPRALLFVGIIEWPGLELQYRARLRNRSDGGILLTDAAYQSHLVAGLGLLERVIVLHACNHNPRPFARLDKAGKGRADRTNTAMSVVSSPIIRRGARLQYDARRI